MLEFHISRQSRDRYKFDESIFQFTGNAVIADFYAARVFAQKMNAKRDLVHYPEQAVSASQINALGLLDEILHAMIANFRKSNPGINAQILNFISGKVGEENLEKTLRKFTEEFPPLAVYRREMDIEEYLTGETDGVNHREYAFEELLVLWLTNANPATHPYRELFDDSRLEKESTYKGIFTKLYDFFDAQPKFGSENQNFIDVLLAPSRHAPYSLTEQLEFIRREWPTYLEGIQLHTKYFSRVLTGLDFIEEEQRIVFPGGGPGPAPVLEYSKLDAEIEAFSPDTHWMPNLVLLAKNTYVWLDQLSKIYERPIQTLDAIPDEVLDQLSGWGFTGLWLIGLWERSPASKSIKRRMGNPDAVSSAYSLYDSVIAADLGGKRRTITSVRVPLQEESVSQRTWSRTTQGSTPDG